MNDILNWLGVTKCAASTATGHRPGYLSDQLDRRATIRSDIVDEIAAILEVQVHQLVDPDLDTDDLCAPSWWPVEKK